ncbi:unnamed protein product [Linum trigynum]|uniref:Secreted protein n=1 Tax=Linum trigynum TaxID=586398 RepID=A0AAV2CY91_9ROSI
MSSRLLPLSRRLLWSSSPPPLALAAAAPCSVAPPSSPSWHETQPVPLQYVGWNPRCGLQPSTAVREPPSGCP